MAAGTARQVRGDVHGRQPGTVSAAYGRNVWEDNPSASRRIDFVARQDDILNLMRDVRWDLVHRR